MEIHVQMKTESETDRRAVRERDGGRGWGEGGKED